MQIFYVYHKSISSYNLSLWNNWHFISFKVKKHGGSIFHGAGPYFTGRCPCNMDPGSIFHCEIWTPGTLVRGSIFHATPAQYSMQLWFGHMSQQKCLSMNVDFMSTLQWNIIVNIVFIRVSQIIYPLVKLQEISFWIKCF